MFTAPTHKKLKDSIDPIQLRKAIDALIQHEKSGKPKKNSKSVLFTENHFVFLEVGFQRVPESNRNPFKIQLPNPIYDKDTDICIFSSDAFNDQIVEASKVFPNSTVIPFAKLKKDYNIGEAKRRLCGSHDLFLGDSAIFSSLPLHLGSHFYKRNKIPISIKNTGNPKVTIQTALNRTYFYTSGGNSCSIRVGKIDFSVDQIFDNIIMAIKTIGKDIKVDVQTLSINFNNGISLPFYHSLPEPKVRINLESKTKQDEEVADVDGQDSASKNGVDGQDHAEDVKDGGDDDSEEEEAPQPVQVKKPANGKSTHVGSVQAVNNKRKASSVESKASANGKRKPTRS